MSDVTFGVKMPEELKQQIDNLIKDSGLRTGKDFMQNLINGYVLEKTKENIPEVAEDLKELQSLTQRINNIYLNLGYRIENITKVQEQDKIQLLSKKDSIILDLQSKTEIITAEKETITEAYNNTVNQNNEHLERVNELTESNNNIKALIDEYKSRIETLSGIIEEYKGYKVENETVKGLLTDKQAKINDLSNATKDKDFTINKLNETIESQKIDNTKTIEQLNTKHNSDMEQLNIKRIAELESLRKESLLNIKLASAEIREELNNKLSQEQQKHNSDIQEYQTKYKTLLEELEESRSLHVSAKKNVTAPLKDNK
jgi:chromosome segregation ATPase